MAQRRTRSTRLTEQLADVSGLSDAEMKVMFGAAVTLGGIVTALRTYQVLEDLGLIHPSRRHNRRHLTVSRPT
jgi:hypothetical protein